MTKSQTYFQLLNKFTPCGAQTLSKMACRYPDSYPKVLENGKNGRVTDVDGNVFIDFISGLGAVSVGYAIDEINEAVRGQLERGVSFSLPTAIEYEAAKKLTELVPWTEMWKFGKNGTDGNVMAIRAARAFTGRTKIMTVGYNGCADQFEIKGVRNAGIPKELDSTITKAQYNDLKSFSDILCGHYACVLLEPMVFETPNTGFLETLRDACNASGTVLIFDEVVTGGRFDKFTASSHFKVQPDLIVLGKGIANGFPLCAVGGTRRIMETFERDDFFASGTFGGETVSLAAFLATGPILERTIHTMIWNGSRIKEAFNNLYTFPGTTCSGYPTRLDFRFPTPVHKALFWQEMSLKGVLVGYTNFVMASHTDEDVTKVIDAMFRSYPVLKLCWEYPKVGLKGPTPIAALRK